MKKIIIIALLSLLPLSGCMENNLSNQNIQIQTPVNIKSASKQKTVKQKEYDEDIISILNFVNTERQANNLEPLTLSDNLINAAKIRAEEASINWSHTRPDGTQYYTVNEDIIYGENLAFNFEKPEDVYKAWMDSPTHKENILYPSYKTIGIAKYKTKDGVTYWAQEFGF